MTSTEGLGDAPRAGAARTIGDDVVEAIVVETLETPHYLLPNEASASLRLAVSVSGLLGVPCAMCLM
ncbi:MAG: hypothetical protein ABIR34_04610 [Marmoricola sp.]